LEQFTYLRYPVFPTTLYEGVLIEIEFDVGVTPSCTNLPVFCRRVQSMTLDSIGSFDLEDTFVYPIPTDPLEKIAVKECQIRENHNCPYSKYPFRKEQQHFQFYSTIKFNHPYKFYVFWDSDAQEKCFEIGGISRILNHHARADCPSSTYQKTLWEEAHFKTPKQIKPSNCYTVTPVRTSTLFVNQVIKRVCFSDITTYHKQPYEHMRDNKDPSKRLVIRPKSTIVTRRQSKTFHYLVEYKNRVPRRVPRWFSFRPRRFNVQKNLQDTLLQYRDGREATKHLLPEQPITWYFKSDTETPRLIRFLDPKPVEIPDPVHPFSVNTDYPAIHNVRLDRRQWIYRELLRTWLLQELI
jgi:hypothetical protein